MRGRTLAAVSWRERYILGKEISEAGALGKMQFYAVYGRHEVSTKSCQARLGTRTVRKSSRMRTIKAMRTRTRTVYCNCR